MIATRVAASGNRHCKSCDWEQKLLTWFAALEFPIREQRLKLGALEYFHFSSEFKVADARYCASFGSHQDRRIAAIKCVAEAIERMTMVDYFANQNTTYPRALCNSNGWAAQSTESQAKENALLEAIERHLILKTFLTSGWNGFRVLQKVQSPAANLTLLIANQSTQGLVAGIVLAQSPKFKGISVGYCLGKRMNIDQSEFWQNAIFEAVDKVLVLDSEPAVDESDSWIRRESNRLLCEPFDIDKCDFSTNEQFIECDLGEYKVESIYLTSKLGLDFELYAGFASSGILIPLFWKSALDEPSSVLVTQVLLKNGISNIPEWHPVI
jgi:hypothetical protein